MRPLPFHTCWSCASESALELGTLLLTLKVTLRQAQLKMHNVTTEAKVKCHSPSDDIYELQFEDEHRAGRNGADATVPIAQLARHVEPGLASDPHELHAFAPARDDAVQRELRRLPALDGRVELGAIEEAAHVVHLDCGCRRRRRACAASELVVDDVRIRAGIGVGLGLGLGLGSGLGQGWGQGWSQG